MVEIVSSGTKQLVLYRKMTSEQGAGIRLFRNDHVLSDLRKRLKTRVFAICGWLGDKDTILTRRFVNNNHGLLKRLGTQGLSGATESNQGDRV